MKVVELLVLDVWGFPEMGSPFCNNCFLKSCKKYPYTDQLERLCSLLGMLDVISICPVAFEIFERLKK